MAPLQITYQRISAVAPRDTNPRTHSKRQIQQICASIEHFGFTNPILVDDSNGVIAGHGRLLAAKQLGMTEVPTIRLSDMNEADVRAYVIADNRLAETAGWDETLLGLELRYLDDLSIDFDLALTGFELPEIEILMEGAAPADTNDEADEVPEPAGGPAVTKPGDIWIIGQHRLICGDATRLETYERLLGKARAQMVFTDPPYNVPIDGHVCGLGSVHHREFTMAAGEMSSAEFTAFLTEVFQHLAAFSQNGALHFQCMDWRHMKEILVAGDAAYTELKNLCVWTKTNGGMGSLYRSQHELVFVFKAGTASHINNVELGKHGRYRTNVWQYAGVNSFGADRDDLSLHPTVKPVAMVMDAIRDCSRRKGVILDAFCGSGTTLVAAEKTGRRGYGIELDPLYADTIMRRMERLFDLPTHLEATGQRFEAVEAERRAASDDAAPAAREAAE